jgi:GNAT superfamily N-acetyltransferase
MATSADLKVAEAYDHDIPALVGLINRAFLVEKFFIDGDRIDAGEVARLMRKGTFLVARAASDSVRAAVYVELRGDRLYLGLLSVDPDKQGGGLGRMMMTHAEEYAMAHGCRAVDIRVVNLRRELPAFYQKLGYAECGIEPFAASAEPKVPCHFISMTKPIETQGG